jgi:hypothetical protein
MMLAGEQLFCELPLLSQIVKLANIIFVVIKMPLIYDLAIPFSANFYTCKCILEVGYASQLSSLGRRVGYRCFQYSST